jgi:ribosomal protein L40E
MSVTNKKDDLKTWKYNVKYLGGHTLCPEQTTGKLTILVEPYSRITFESSKFNMEIPVAKITDIRNTNEKYVDPANAILIGVAGLLIKTSHKALMITFEGDSGSKQSPLFEFIIQHAWEKHWLEEATANITSLKLNENNGKRTPSQPTTPSTQTLPVLFCRYCGSKNDGDAVWCQSCGKKVRGEQSTNPIITEVACSKCGTKNKAQAAYCKKCGMKMI